MSLQDTWFDVYATAQIGPALRAALGLWLALTVAAFSLVGPLATWLLTRVLAAAGGPAIDTATLTSVLATPAGLGLLVAAALALLAAPCLGMVGLMHVSAGASRAATPRSVDALLTAVVALPRWLGAALWQLPALLGLALLAGAGGLVAVFDNGPARLLALAAGLAALALALRRVVDGVLALPVALYRDHRGRTVLSTARTLIAGQRWRALRLLVTNLLLALGISAALLWLLTATLNGLIGQTPLGAALVARTILGLALALPVAVLVGWLFVAGYALTAMHLYLAVQRLDGLPNRAWALAARTIPRRGLLPGVLLWCMLLAMLGTALMLSRTITADLGLAREVLVIANRGASASAPENTLSALYQAITDGADLAMVNVQETADGVVVLLHDPDLRRVAGLGLSIWEVQYADLRRADLGKWFSPRFQNETVTTLEEALMVAESRLPLVIELKDYGHNQRLVEAVAELLLASRCSTHCLVTSEHPAALARLRELAPQIRVGLVVAAPFASLEAIDARVAAAVGPHARLALDLLSVDAALLTPDLVRANRVAGRETHAWTVDDPNAMARLIDWGVDAIITNQPARLRGLLVERQRMSDREWLLMTLGRQLRP